MKSGSRSVISHQLQDGSPDPAGAGPDWLRDCLIDSFPGGDAAPAPDTAASPPGKRRLRLPPPGSTPQKRTSRRAATADSGERRQEERPALSVYRSALLHWQSVEALCLIRNVSAGGMMGRVLVDLPVGTEILVEMRSGHEIPGHVVWAGDRQIGVQFDDAIEVEQVVNGAHRAMQGWRQRMPRIHTPCAATLLAPDGRQTVTLLDLSQGGAKIEGELLRVGEEVTLAVKGLEAHRGTIRWACGGRAGIAFVAAIPFDTLALWSLQRQVEMGRIDAAPPPRAAEPGNIAA
jgi:PilZ domain-containing protein